MCTLNCSFRETGLAPQALVSYECNAAAAAVVEGCFINNKFVPDAGTEVTVALDVSNVEAGHDPELFIANNSGSINGTVLTALPEPPHGGGGHLCAEPVLGEFLIMQTGELEKSPREGMRGYLLIK